MATKTKTALGIAAIVAALVALPASRCGAGLGALTLTPAHTARFVVEAIAHPAAALDVLALACKGAQ